jgi:hypothetical protein
VGEKADEGRVLAGARHAIDNQRNHSVHVPTRAPMIATALDFYALRRSE